MDNRPIAVIDSGVGGLASLRSIRSVLPCENIIYFGDTAHMPYGSKTKSEICSYASAFSKYLESLGCKMLILACGTLSSTAVDTIYKTVPNLLVCDIINPVISSAIRNISQDSRIGLIATQRTIDSGIYQTAFSRLSKHYDMYFQACPELASCIEKGICEGPGLEQLIRSYLDVLVKDDHIDYLLLACTHYPIIQDIIERIYPGLTVIDPSVVLAKNSDVMLDIHELSADDGNIGSLRLLVSKKTAAFSDMAAALGFGDIPVEEVHI